MLAYYAHQHGSGHSNYAQIFARHSGYKMPVFTSSKFQFDPQVDLISMPAEDPDGTGVGTDTIPNPDYLHYSPVGQKSIQERSALFLNEITNRSINLVIVDLSVEIAALCRSSSIPYAYVRLPGKRDDLAHIQAFQGATFLLAYYPAELDGPEIPQWIKDKTIYTGFFSKFDNTSNSNYKASKSVRIFTGNGGNKNLIQNLPHLRTIFSDYPVEVYGMDKGDYHASNLSYKGKYSDPRTLMINSSIIVANCGLNLTSEILSLGRTFISIPEDRPYGEQYAMHQFLATERLSFDITDNYDLEKLINIRSTILSRYINQQAPMDLIKWMEKYQYHPGSMANKIKEFKFNRKQLKTA